MSAIEVFHGAINTVATDAEYTNKLKRYEEFFKINDWDDYIKKDPNEIHDHLVYYINSQKKLGIKNSTIKNMMSSIFLMLEMNRVVLYKKILHKMLPDDKETSGGKLPYLTEEIQSMLDSTDRFRIKALIHFLASTGSRPAAITDPVLRMKHLKKIEDCLAIKIYDGSREGYWTFLTPEAVNIMEQYHKSRKLNGEEFNDETPIFSNENNTHSSRGGPISTATARTIMYRILAKANVSRTKKGQRFDKAAIYGFRKRFNTILKLNNDVNSNIAEKLMAHKRGLDGTYLQPTMEECYAEFKKAIPELTVDGTARKQAELEAERTAKDELQQKLDEHRDTVREQVADILNEKLNEMRATGYLPK